MKAHGPPALRWLSVALRSLHLVAVICLGAEVLGAPLPSQSTNVLLSGIAMFALDLWNKPRLLLEWSGLALLLKLCMIVLMALYQPWRLPIFLGVVVWSVIFAHAPASFRHSSWWRSGTGNK